MVNSETNVIGAKLIKGDSLIEAGISIANGKIIKIGKDSNLPKADRTIQAKGLLALPGLIDAHVHLRDMKLSHKEDFYTGTCASAAGGFTTILDMPNTIPPTDSSEKLREKINLAKKKIVVNVGFHAMVADKTYELLGMAEMGAFSFKLYFNKPESGLDVEDEEVLKEVMQECARIDIPLTIHAEEFVREKIQRIDSLEHLLNKHKAKLEIEAVKRTIELVKESGVQAHICHVSTNEALSLIKKAKKDGIKVTCEVTPHHLFLSKELFKKLGTLVLTEPPIRSKANAKKLQKALLEGPVDMVASDHAPHTLKEKLCSYLENAPPGVPGLETTLPLLLTKVNSGRLTIKRLVEILAEKPAEIFHMHGKGFLKERMDADITLIDMKAKHRIDSESLFTKARYSPFDGFECTGKAIKVMVSGEVVMDSGQIIANPGIGTVVKRG